jgi:hypothetical protein
MNPPISAEQQPSADADRFRKAGLMGMSDKRSRSTDPATSKQAAAKAARFAESHAGRILAALMDGPATAHELSALTGLTVVQIDRRLPELADMGRACVVLHMGEPMQRGGARVWGAV